jgi:hypothetical protein
MQLKSAIITQAAGKIGGLAASTNHGAITLGVPAMPAFRQTSVQADQRDLLASVSRLWHQTLTSTQRRAWEDWARRSTIQTDSLNPRPLTGREALVRANSLRSLIPLPAVTDPPALATLPTLHYSPAFSFGNNTAVNVLLDTDDPWQAADGNYLFSYVSPHQAQSDGTQPKRWHLRDVLPSSAAGGPYSAVSFLYGFRLPARQMCYLRATIIMADGRRNDSVIGRMTPSFAPGP